MRKVEVTKKSIEDEYNYMLYDMSQRGCKPGKKVPKELVGKIASTVDVEKSVYHKHGTYYAVNIFKDGITRVRSANRLNAEERTAETLVHKFNIADMFNYNASTGTFTLKGSKTYTEEVYMDIMKHLQK